MIYVNIFFAFLLAVWAKRDFERNFNTAGWISLFGSAFNAAVVMNHFV